MKMVMFTPGLRASAIGRMACIVVRELKAQDVDVTVVRCEAPRHFERPTHAFDTAVIPWNDEAAVAGVVAAADLVVYHVGDNFDFHQGAIAWLERHPGVVCLHDFYLGHLFHGWAAARKTDAARILRSFYGEGADSVFFAAARRASFIAETTSMPSTEWVVAMASGVVTHSSWDIHRVIAACAGPVRVVPLAYEALAQDRSASHEPPAPGQMRVLTVGHANANKRMESVIRAIGGSPWLRDNAVYRHVGFMDADVLMTLSALASGLGVDFVASGELDDAGLAQAFDWADVVSCLRSPSLEAASASAIESMLYGKAIVVSDGGFYSEIDDLCAVRIDTANEIASLRRALERLAADPVGRQALGDCARQWAERTFRADHYARELVVLGREAATHPPFAGATSFFFDTLARWGGDARWLTLPSVLDPMAIFDFSPKDSGP